MRTLTTFIFALSFSCAYASMGRMLQLRGYLVKFDKTEATIKDEKGLMKVPSRAIDQQHVIVGQWVTVNVDFVDFYRMNPAKFDDAAEAKNKKSQ